MQLTLISQPYYEAVATARASRPVPAYDPPVLRPALRRAAAAVLARLVHTPAPSASHRAKLRPLGIERRPVCRPPEARVRPGPRRGG